MWNKYKIIKNLLFILILVLFFCSNEKLFADNPWGFKERHDSRESDLRKEERLLRQISQNPNDPTLYVKIANHYFSSGNINEAIAYSYKAIELEPNNTSNSKSLAEILLKVNRIDEAIKIMEKSHQINPDDYDTLTYLATLYSIAGQKDKVIDTLNQGIEKNTDRKANLRVKLAEFYVRHKQYKDAIEQYKLIISERPDLAHFQEEIDKLNNQLSAVNKESEEVALKEPRDATFKKGKEITLKELKNVYIDFEITASTPFGIKMSKMSDSVKANFKSNFIDKIKNIGVNIVSNEGDADVVIKFKIENALKEIIGEWSASKATVVIQLSNSGYAIAQYTTTPIYGYYPEISKIITRMVEEIRKDYELTGPKIYLTADDMPLDNGDDDVGSVRRQFVVESNETGPNGESIYNIKNAKTKIVSLIYRSYNNKDLDFPEKINDLSKIKLEIKKHDFENETKDIFHRYGYFIGTNRKGERRIIDTDNSAYVLYPEDLDSTIRRVVNCLLFENGCSVVDITPIKSSLNETALSDIIERYKSQNIDALFIFYYQLYSKIHRTETIPNGTRSYNDYGLVLNYTAMLIDINSKDVIFKYSGSASAYMPATIKPGFWSSTMMREAPLEWFKSKDDGPGGYYIIKRSWLEDKLFESIDSKNAPPIHYKPNTIIIEHIKPLPSELNYYFTRYFRKIKDVSIK